MNYTIPNIFLEAFGLKVEKMYSPSLDSNLPQDPNGLYQGIEIVEDLQEATKLSHLGTPILFPITFLSGTYQYFDRETGEILRKQMPEFQLPSTCVASFRRPKVINKTRMNGGYSTVKEIFGFTDYEITINGFFIPEPGQPQGFVSPKAQEDQMVKWDDLADAVQVSSQIFLSREIHTILIEDFQPVPQRGRPNLVPFTIRAVSDEIIQTNNPLIWS
ncbi:DUF6046 domain-containing protein [Gramella lutea]|uniref:DUF6046 domain-containing protein n=1 Tax=Christiangramia lutea TaxID=1607951 RepID=A0A9X1V512_9FLAO|nr:DUF6046 domain-containing protein [Christiangramia lutea]MCH4824299.1 DUF6046 domain-containing protein [Christiangramia lutea]